MAHRVVLEKWPLNVCMCVCVFSRSWMMIQMMKITIRGRKLKRRRVDGRPSRKAIGSDKGRGKIADGGGMTVAKKKVISSGYCGSCHHCGKVHKCQCCYSLHFCIHYCHHSDSRRESHHGSHHGDTGASGPETRHRSQKLTQRT